MTNYYFKIVANDVELDTFADEAVLVSNNATGLFDIDKLPSDFTRELTLPGSKRNNDFFYYNRIRLVLVWSWFWPGPGAQILDGKKHFHYLI